LTFNPSILSWELSNTQESLAVLTLPSNLRVIYDAIRQGSTTSSDLAQHLKLHRNTVAREVNKLVDLGLIDKKTFGKQVVLSLSQDPANEPRVLSGLAEVATLGDTPQEAGLGLEAEAKPAAGAAKGVASAATSAIATSSSLLLSSAAHGSPRQAANAKFKQAILQGKVGRRKNRCL
jgi:uncharacterized membrane protein